MSSYSKQVRTVLLIEVIILAFCASISLMFWGSICETSIEACLNGMDNFAPGYFLFLSIVRPFVFTPVSFFAYLAEEPFGLFYGTILTSLGATLSAMILFGCAKLVGKRLINPWLSSNLPQTLKFLRSQDWKITVACRFIPIIPFDLFSFAFGLVDFRFKYVMLATFLTTLPEAYMMAAFANSKISFLNSTISTVTILSMLFLLPGLVFEIISRKKGSSLWTRLKAMWAEILGEVRLNNSIVKRHAISGEKTPVLLLYGFFSSRRAVTVIERQLIKKGYEVLSFNLGGLLGVFFTKGIIETANFIDYKIKRQFQRHNFDQIYIVGHSKGGLVALWWVLKLGGYRYCKKVITMGTPFNGTKLTWLALITPLGFMWKDLWQMRPSSRLLREIKESKIPNNVEIHCIFSDRDAVAKGKNGLLQSSASNERIFPVPLHQVSHFEFLYRRSVGDTIADILGPPQLSASTSSTNSGSNHESIHQIADRTIERRKSEIEDISSYQADSHTANTKGIKA
ncbi:MAG: alpha/beta fold hydrolase [Bdellovibrionota bacterium]